MIHCIPRIATKHRRILLVCIVIVGLRGGQSQAQHPVISPSILAAESVPLYPSDTHDESFAERLGRKTLSVTLPSSNR